VSSLITIPTLKGNAMFTMLTVIRKKPDITTEVFRHIQYYLSPAVVEEVVQLVRSNAVVTT
jgi:hypothetical protein